MNSDGNGIFISGACGATFIFGRLGGLEIGISSAYQPTSIVYKFGQNICWAIK